MRDLLEAITAFIDDGTGGPLDLLDAADAPLMSPGEVDITRQVMLNEGSRGSEIRRAIGADRGSTYVMLKRMLEKGFLVVRHVPLHEDGPTATRYYASTLGQRTYRANLVARAAYHVAQNPRPGAPDPERDRLRLEELSRKITSEEALGMDSLELGTLLTDAELDEFEDLSRAEEERLGGLRRTLRVRSKKIRPDPASLAALAANGNLGEDQVREAMGSFLGSRPRTRNRAEDDHVQRLTTLDRDDRPIPPTCAYCGRTEDLCEGTR